MSTPTVTVSVTQEHIDHGKQRTCDDCPIALAILEGIPGLLNAEVMNPNLGFVLLLDTDGGAATLNLPQSARDFIHRE